MVENNKPRLVGVYIRQRREAMGLSQRALGLMFSPPVTTQFISNVEGGLTPLPPAHVSTLTKALMVSEAELMGLLEKEYSAKLSGRLGRPGENGADGAPISANGVQTLVIGKDDYELFRKVYDAYQSADVKTKQAFATVCESMLNLPKSVFSTEKHD